jgi:GAF domain-containing protein
VSQAARARESALRAVLDLISRSRDDGQPVFRMILKSALHLCEATVAELFLATEDRVAVDLVEVASLTDRPPQVDSHRRLFTDTGSKLIEAVVTGRVVHLDDVTDTDRYRNGGPAYRRALAGQRTTLLVPLLSARGVIGALCLWRSEVKPFTADEIALVETFAAQAVIAIENAQHFRELQTRLKREAATREVLEVISRSRDDDAPVFDLLVKSAQALCDAPISALILVDPVRNTLSLAAHCGYSETAVALFASGAMRLDAEHSYAAKAIVERTMINLPDLAESELYRAGSPIVRTMVDEVGIRSVMFVPLMSGGEAIGNFSLLRFDNRPFADKHVELVRTFAAQAVIAIENVRQFRELKDSLEHQEATSDILRVISQSREDETRVFDLILEKAAVLCDADQGGLVIVNEARTHIRLMADWGHDRTAWQPGTEFSLDLPLPIMATIRTAEVVHIEDYSQSDAYKDRDPIAVRMVETEGHRTRLIVPLLQNGIAIGGISLSRREVRSFTPDEIALVQTFAAQAVIAIENVRQFRELQARLAREAATREILEVISASRDDETPVFDAILRNAVRLCNSRLAGLNLGRRGDSHIRLAATVGWSAEAAAAYVTSPLPMDGDVSFIARSILDKELIHIPDMQRSELYLRGTGPALAIASVGVRAMLIVPLVLGDQAIGAISLHRLEAEPFTPAQIDLVQSFAAQAVIAIENVRQFKALEALNAELGDRVQDQVGEIERMGRLKRFLPSAVADAVVSSGSEKMLKSHRALLGVLFADIRGFTAFCETAEPEETIEVLQTYHEEMGRLIEAHHAGVDHRMGDGIMVLFNDPLPCDDPAGAAVGLAVAMRARMAELCAKWKKMGYRLGFGVGISLGYATVGMVGAGGRHDYTASGTAVNLAARLCDEAADGEILLSPRAAIAVEGVWSVESRGARSLKGIREPVEMFGVTGAAG